MIDKDFVARKDALIILDECKRLRAELAAERESVKRAEKERDDFRREACRSANTIIESVKASYEADNAKLREALERARPWVEIMKNSQDELNHIEAGNTLRAIDAVLAETGGE